MQTISQRARVAIFYETEQTIRQKLTTKDSIMGKGCIRQEAITIINIDTHKIKASKYMR